MQILFGSSIFQLPDVYSVYGIDTVTVIIMGAWEQ